MAGIKEKEALGTWKTTEMGDQRAKHILWSDLWHFSSPPSTCNLQAHCENQQWVLGKTGGGLSFFNTNNICVDVCGVGWGGLCVFVVVVVFSSKVILSSDSTLTPRLNWIVWCSNNCFTRGKKREIFFFFWQNYLDFFFLLKHFRCMWPFSSWLITVKHPLRKSKNMPCLYRISMLCLCTLYSVRIIVTFVS